MVWQYTPYTAPVFLAAVIGLGVAAFAWKNRDRPGATPLAAFMLAASVWSVAEGLNLAHADLAGKVFWTRVEVVAAGFVPIAWLALVLEYTGNERWITPRIFGALLLEPLFITVVLAWQPELVRPELGVTTVDSFVLITEEFGPVFYLHAIWSYLLVFVGAALLLKIVLFTEGIYRTQATALLLATFLPVIGNVMYLFDVLPAGLDPTNLGFLFTGFVITATILRRQLLEVVPIAREVARDEILADMDDHVIVLDDPLLCGEVYTGSSADDTLEEVNVTGDGMVTQWSIMRSGYGPQTLIRNSGTTHFAFSLEEIFTIERPNE